MGRCAHELINKINAGNVADLLVMLFPHQKRESKHARITEDTDLAQMQAHVI